MSAGAMNRPESTGPRESARTGRPVTWPWLAGVRRWLARRPTGADAILVLLLIVTVSGPVKFGIHDRRLLELLFTLLIYLPLVWRRRNPMLVFGFLALVALVQLAGGLPAAADFGLLVALYTVAAHCSRKRALLAGAVLELGVALAVIRWAPPQGMLAGFVFLSGMVTAAFVLGVNLQTRRAYLASLEDRAVRAEHERDQQSQIATATERARIAREMHDIVAHNLSVMIALADGAAFAAQAGSPQAEIAARQVSATGRAALAEMHRVLGVLRVSGPTTPLAPQPGVEQLDELVSQVRSAGLATSFTVVGRPFRLPSTAQLAIYRLVQEALTNVLKHANSPTEAKVRLTYFEPVVELEITDDGRARPNGRPGDGGHGLAGMRERTAMFGGKVEAGPRTGGGWRVSAQLNIGRQDAGLVAP